MHKIDHLILEMISFDSSEPKLIQHFLKVHEFARLIGIMESLSTDEMEILEAATIVHDIGIKVCKKKYGKCTGKMQEEEGPPYAEQLLKKIGFNKNVIDRVSYLVAHHHTYSNIDGMDYQILVEADFLVNLYEDHCSPETIQITYRNIFKTKSGQELCKQMFMKENDTIQLHN